MAIVYPISLPSSPAPSRMVWKQLSAVGMTVSNFTGNQQIQEHQGAGWQVEVTLPPMTRANAEAWIAALLKLRGRNGTFLLPPYSSQTNRGISTGKPYLNGASGVSPTIATGGWTASQTNIVREGDWLEFHQNYLSFPSAFDNAAWTKAGTGGASAPTITPNIASPLAPQQHPDGRPSRLSQHRWRTDDLCAGARQRQPLGGWADFHCRSLDSDCYRQSKHGNYLG